MKRKKIEIDYLARLAKLELLAKEKKSLASQLEESMDYVEILKELKVEKAAPAAQVTGLTNVFRDDFFKKGLSQKQALANASQTWRGYFVAPRIKWE